MSFVSESQPPRWRDVRIAVVAKAASYSGDFLAATALALSVQARGDRGYGVAALLIAATLPMAVFARIGGRLADRMDSRRLLVTVGVAQAAVCAALAYTSAVPVMIVAVALLSVGLAVTQPTVSALIPEMVGTENLPKAMAYSQVAGAVGMLSGPMLGGLLVGAYGVRVPLLLDAVSYLAIVVAGLAIQTRRGGRAGRTVPVPGRLDRALADPAPGSWRLRDDKLLVTLFVAFSCVIGAVTVVNVAEIFFVRVTLGASATMYGLVSGVWTLGVLVGAGPFGRLSGGDRRLVLVQLILLSGLSGIVLLSAGAWSAWLLLPLYLAGGAMNAGLNVLSGVVVGRRSPAADRGKVFGTLTAAGAAASLIGYAAGGLLVPLVSARWIMAGTGAVGMVIAAGFVLSLVAQAAPGKVQAGAAIPVGYRGEP